MEAESNKKQEHFEQSDKRTDKLRSHLKGGVTDYLTNMFLTYILLLKDTKLSLISIKQSENVHWFLANNHLTKWTDLHFISTQYQHMKEEMQSVGTFDGKTNARISGCHKI